MEDKLITSLSGAGLKVPTPLRITLASLLLATASAYSYFILCLAYIGIVGGLYEFSEFVDESLYALTCGTVLLTVFLATYVPSMIYLCKKLYKVKKWMVIIPVLGSLIIIFLSIALYWQHYQWE